MLAHPVLGLAQRLTTAPAQRNCVPYLHLSSNQECISAQHTLRRVCRTSQRSRQLSSRLPTPLPGANGEMSGKWSADRPACRCGLVRGCSAVRAKGELAAPAAYGGMAYRRLAVMPGVCCCIPAGPDTGHRLRWPAWGYHSHGGLITASDCGQGVGGGMRRCSCRPPVPETLGAG